MQQLSLELFFPLTEQSSLDLDFKPCQEYADAKRKNQVCYTGGFISAPSATISNITTSISLMPDNNSIGYWQVGEGLRMHNSKEPNWLHKQMSKIFFGWKWNKTK